MKNLCLLLCVLFANVYSFSQTIEATTTSALSIDIYKVDVVTPAVTGVDVDTDIPLSGKSYTNRYALIIGNENYSVFTKVDFALNDANVFEKYAKNILGIPAENIINLRDANSDEFKANIIKFAKLIQLEKGNGEYFVYYSGHGDYEVINGDTAVYLLPASAYETASGIKLEEFYAKLSEHDSKKVVVFLDACFSGGGRTGDLVIGRSPLRINVNPEKINNKLIILAASSEKQISQPYTEKQHGLFTYYLLSKLKETKGDITYGTLSYEVIKSVTKTSLLSTSQKFEEQVPTVNVGITLEKQWSNLKVND